MPSAANRHDEGVRPWVKRLASYLRIFGNARGDAPSKEHAYYIDSLTRMAKEREAEHDR